MAMPGTMVYEFRASASNNNGGGFKDGGTGTDYSLQDAAEYNDTDLVIDGADDTKITSAAHNFVASDVDNVINITAGVGFTPGRYHIVSCAGNEATLDRACGSTGSTGGTYYVGGALALPTAAILNTFIPGNKAWVEAGTYTLTGHVALTADGTPVAPIVVEGYNSSRGDAPTGNDRPLIAAAANATDFDDYWELRNIRETTTSSSGLRGDLGAVFINCKSENSSGTGARNAFYSTAYGRLWDCEGVSTNGTAISVSSGLRVIHCYLHDSVTGILPAGSGSSTLIDNIIDTCTTAGINLISYDLHTIKNNTIYGCGTGILATDSKHNVFLNNLIDTCTTGAEWSTEQKTDVWKYNNWNGNGTDVSKVTKGDNATANVPGFAGAAGGDFSDVDAANGFGIRLGVG